MKKLKKRRRVKNGYVFTIDGKMLDIETFFMKFEDMFSESINPTRSVLDSKVINFMELHKARHQLIVEGQFIIEERHEHDDPQESEYYEWYESRVFKIERV